MKITEYPAVTELDDDNVFILDGTNGTKKIAKSDLTYALFDSIPEMHRNIFRGKNLGTAYTSAQKQEVYNGTFHDLWVGDYWEISGNKWRIVDMDYFAHSDDKHHLVIMCDKIIHKVDSYCSVNSKVPYSQSNPYMANGRDAYLNTKIPSTFKQNMFQHPEVICSGQGGNGEATSWEEVTNTLQNPTHAQIFGSTNPYTLNIASQIPQNQSNGINQFALMRLDGRFTAVDGLGDASITSNAGFVLRDPCGWGTSATSMFTRVLYDSFGCAMTTIDYGTSACGMRPYFAISGSL